MHNSNIVTIAYGTGGAEIMDILHKNKEFVNIVNFNLSKFAQSKNPLGTRIELEEFLEYINKNRPHVIINERSNGIETHQIIERKCIELNIPTICLLDVELGTGRFDELPSYIICPSKEIKMDLINYGFKKDCIYVCGNPAFDSIHETKYTRKVNTANPRILYISQGPMQLNFEDIYKCLNNIFVNFSLDVKLHPQEDEFNCYDYIQFNNTSIVHHDNREDFIPKCLEYDLVIGISSTIQLKTSMIGIPTIFIKNIDDFSNMLSIYKHEPKAIKNDNINYEKEATQKVINTIIDISSKLIK